MGRSKTLISEIGRYDGLFWSVNGSHIHFHRSLWWRRLEILSPGSPLLCSVVLLGDVSLGFLENDGIRATRNP